jgi:hypothetical protein
MKKVLSVILGLLLSSYAVAQSLEAENTYEITGKANR